MIVAVADVVDDCCFVAGLMGLVSVIVIVISIFNLLCRCNCHCY